jgi:hypothetical protein
MGLVWKKIVLSSQTGCCWRGRASLGKKREEHHELPLHAMLPRANGGGSQSRNLGTRNGYSSTTRAREMPGSTGSPLTVLQTVKGAAVLVRDQLSSITNHEHLQIEGQMLPSLRFVRLKENVLMQASTVCLLQIPLDERETNSRRLKEDYAYIVTTTTITPGSTPSITSVILCLLN